MAAKSSPDPIDVACGARVRYYRKRRGSSQTALANALGVTFQQVQKYERGSNRISVSMLTRIAAFLEAPASELMGESSAPVADEMVTAIMVDGADRMLKAYSKMPKETRSAMVALAETLVKR